MQAVLNTVQDASTSSLLRTVVLYICEAICLLKVLIIRLNTYRLTSVVIDVLRCYEVYNRLSVSICSDALHHHASSGVYCSLADRCRDYHDEAAMLPRRSSFVTMIRPAIHLMEQSRSCHFLECGAMKSLSILRETEGSYRSARGRETVALQGVRA